MPVYPEARTMRRKPWPQVAWNMILMHAVTIMDITTMVIVAMNTVRNISARATEKGSRLFSFRVNKHESLTLLSFATAPLVLICGADQS